MAAGVAVGIGLIIKVTALYLLAAALLSIAAAGQELHTVHSSVQRKWTPSAAVIVGAVMLAAMVLWLLRDRTAAPELLHLVVPVVLLVLALSVREVRIVRTGGRNWNELLVPTAWLVAGVAVPVMMLALP